MTHHSHIHEGQEHYHAHAGLCGYLPNFTSTLESYDAAVDTLVDLHELGQKRSARLRRDGYITLNLNRDGNEYAEVVECYETECAEDSDA